MDFVRGRYKMSPYLGLLQTQKSYLDESQNDLSRIFDGDKMIDIQNSDRLKSFYQKLMETDAAIRKMRKSSFGNTERFDNINNIDINNNVDFNSNYDLNSDIDINNNIDYNKKIQNIIPDRLKRSVKFYHPMKLFHHEIRKHATKPRITNGKFVSQTTISMNSNKKFNNFPRNKRYDSSNSMNTEGLIIEKNKVVIEYKPSKSRIVAKCSHAPKDSKSHETQLKHPFYKNSQRFDELLGQFLDKKIPDFDKTILDHFEDIMENNRIKNPSNEEIDEVTVKDDEHESTYKGQTDKNFEKEAKKDLVVVEPIKEDREQTKVEPEKITKQFNALESEFFDYSEGVDNKKERRAEPAYDILLSVSTIISPVTLRTSLIPVSGYIDRGPNLRKLMQANLREKAVEYEDLKEVLPDHKVEQDNSVKNDERQKRDEELRTITTEADKQRDPIGVNNPNWKGLMPLYPEELSHMMKTDKVEFPLQNKDTPETDNADPGLKDVEYMEDYLENGFEKLVYLAQAYSDYGVLNENKEERKSSDKGKHKKEREAKMSKPAILVGLKDEFKHKVRKSNFFGRLKKGSVIDPRRSEGIRIEMRPTSKIREDNNVSGLIKLIHGHVKLTNKNQKNKLNMLTTPEIAENSQIHGIMNPYTDMDKVKTQKSFDPIANTLVFTINKRRTLNSINFKNDLDELSETSTEDGIYGRYSDTVVKFKRDTNNTLENIIFKDVNATQERKTASNDNKDNLTLIKKSVNGTRLNEKLKENLKNADQNNNMTLSDFFMLLSNWFSSLDGVHVTSNRSIVADAVTRNKSEVVEKYSNESISTKNTVPQYDLVMNNNVGYKSRGLLSINDNNNTSKSDDTSKTEHSGEEQHMEGTASTETMKNPDITALFQTTQSMTNEEIKDNAKNRIVKRQAIDDSNLIFWNDLYDDEYGVNDDPLENTIRNKHSVDKNYFFKKSNNWLQDKIQMISNRLNMPNSKTGGRNSRETRTNSFTINGKRYARGADYESGTNKKVDFAALTAKMKEVCKRTAMTIQQTKNIQVREERDEGNLATSLMQQLVRLMTDLVDFQVQERTCRSLPPDLQKFLEWLTSTKNEGPYDFDAERKDETTTDQNLQQQSDRNDPDSKTDCLGTFHAVQDLIQQYEDMSDDDKSLMTGVKDYLENQRNYLERQLSATDEYNLSKRDDSRYKRDAISHSIQSASKVVDVTAHAIVNKYKNLKCRYHKYMEKLKKASKKANKVTADFRNATASISKKLKKVKSKHNQNKICLKDKGKEKHKGSPELKDKHHRDLSTRRLTKDIIQLKDHVPPKARDNVKNLNERNIKDVYFKAVEEAKTSTVKSGDKRVSGIYDKTDILRII